MDRVGEMSGLLVCVSSTMSEAVPSVWVRLIAIVQLEQRRDMRIIYCIYYLLLHLKIEQSIL